MFLAGVGIVRMPDVFMRISACTKAATLGVTAILIAAAIFCGNIGAASRAVATILFVLLTAPVAAHMIGRSAYLADADLWDHTVIDELHGRYNLKDGKLLSPPETAPKEHTVHDPTDTLSEQGKGDRAPGGTGNAEA
jgi:multicomponent Na+:H+ antiporter subunit G